MFVSFLCLLLFQLLGEALSQTFDLPLPGAVVGMILLLTALFCFPRLHSRVQETSHFLLKNMSLFYIPAGIGLMTLLETVGRNKSVLFLVIVFSTLITGIMTALTFSYLQRKI